MLTPGTSVSVSTVTQHADNVITIPVDCVYYESGKAYTYVVDGDVARKVYMETGLYDTDNIEIISGLGENASVITTWSSDLRDGLPIEVSGGESGSTELNSHNEMGLEVIDLTISVNSAL